MGAPAPGKRAVAEGLGTLLLVYFGADAAAITLMLARGTTPGTSFSIGIGALGGLADWLAIGMAFAIVIAAMIYALGRVSGAHLNPAVTIALAATRRFPWSDTAVYVVAQLVGTALGSVLFALSAGADAVVIGGLGATAPFPGIGTGQAILAEAIGTFVLMLVIMGVAVDRRVPPGLAGVVIGLTVGGIITTTGNIAGSSLNPALTPSDRTSPTPCWAAPCHRRGVPQRLARSRPTPFFLAQG